eukprot:3941124-Rhodomonas_salina.2
MGHAARLLGEASLSFMERNEDTAKLHEHLTRLCGSPRDRHAHIHIHTCRRSRPCRVPIRTRRKARAAQHTAQHTACALLRDRT